MEDNHFNEILQVFEKGSELNVGLHPNLNVVKYGFHYLEKKITLLLQATHDEMDTIKEYLKSNLKINFNKFSKNGQYVLGDGFVKIIEDEDHKLDGINHIIKQHKKNNIEYNIKAKNLNELLIFELVIDNIHLIK